MTKPRQAQLPLLLSISEGLSRGMDEMLRVSPQGDAIHPPSCSLAIREAVEEIERLRAEIERLHTEKDKLREEKEVLHVAVAMIERAAAGAIYSQESIYVMASSALEALETKP